MASNGIERYKSAGVHTVEGNLAGARAAKLAKERDRQQQEYEQKKQDIHASNQRGARIDDNFESHRDDDESEFKVRSCAIGTYWCCCANVHVAHVFGLLLLPVLW